MKACDWIEKNYREIMLGMMAVEILLLITIVIQGFYML